MAPLNLNFVGCSTGKSAALALFRILSTSFTWPYDLARSPYLAIPTINFGLARIENLL